MGRHSGVPKTVRTGAAEENVLDAVAEDPIVSVRYVVHKFQVSKCTVYSSSRATAPSIPCEKSTRMTTL